MKMHAIRNSKQCRSEYQSLAYMMMIMILQSNSRLIDEQWSFNECVGRRNARRIYTNISAHKIEQCSHTSKDILSKLQLLCFIFIARPHTFTANESSDW